MGSDRFYVSKEIKIESVEAAVSVGGMGRRMVVEMAKGRNGKKFRRMVVEMAMGRDRKKFGGIARGMIVVFFFFSNYDFGYIYLGYIL